MLTEGISTHSNSIIGTVKDVAEGPTLAGVNVVVKGTSIGALTGVDGRYSITALTASGATLVFSYTGYKTLEVEINNQQVIDITLSGESKSLQEVV